MKIAFDAAVTGNFETASGKEWLETNGVGGWASSSLAGAHTRRYHGLLVAATNPPVGRMVMVSKLDEALGIGGMRYELGCNRYPSVVSPRGFTHLVSFTRDLFPQFDYEAGGVRIRKTVAAVHGENTTLIRYDVLKAPSSFMFELQPFIAARDYHSLTHANDAMRREAAFHNGVFRVRPYDGVPEVFISVPGAAFEARPDWYRNFEYALEQYRGLDYREDLFTHGVFTKELSAGDSFGVIVSTEDPREREAIAMMQAEETRRRGLIGTVDADDDVVRLLTHAADQFIVSRGKDLRTLIAGYHWFSDWGRDTMIALPGVMLVTDRHEDAGKVLREFANSVSEGMLPNRFPDAGEQPEYNTVDATLWFFVAVYRYLQYTSDDAFVRDELLSVLNDIVSWHDRGTRYNIHVDSDGLLYAGEEGVQLTWMDAKVGNWVVTPRRGKAVEINALWYNVLEIMANLCARFGRHREAERYAQRASGVRRAFQDAFWNHEGEYLYDYIDGEYRDRAIRPNQIFSLSLPFPLLEGQKARRVLGLVEEKLLTPVGLRSLAADDPAYRAHYGGDQWSRDSSYHQGTVWSWLLGPFVTALVRIEGDAGRSRARKILQGVMPHLLEAGLGTISEIFDADAPHAPRGCVAQAWSVGEILRAYCEDVLGNGGKQEFTIRARLSRPGVSV